MSDIVRKHLYESGMATGGCDTEVDFRWTSVTTTGGTTESTSWSTSRSASMFKEFKSVGKGRI